MVRKIPCFCRVPKSTRTSSLTVSVESDAMFMSDWNDVITQPSLPPATASWGPQRNPDAATAQAAAMAAIAIRAARVVMGVLTQIRRQCYATYYAAVRNLVAASGNPTRCFVGLGPPDRSQKRARVRNPKRRIQDAGLLKKRPAYYALSITT